MFKRTLGITMLIAFITILTGCTQIKETFCFGDKNKIIFEVKTEELLYERGVEPSEIDWNEQITYQVGCKLRTIQGEHVELTGEALNTYIEGIYENVTIVYKDGNSQVSLVTTLHVVDTIPPSFELETEHYTIHYETFKGDQNLFRKELRKNVTAADEENFEFEYEQTKIQSTGTLPVIYILKDQAGNSIQKEITVEIVDKKSPTIELINGKSSFIVDKIDEPFDVKTILDVQDDYTDKEYLFEHLEIVSQTGEIGNGATVHYVVKITDEHNNSSEFEFDVHFIDLGTITSELSKKIYTIETPYEYRRDLYYDDLATMIIEEVETTYPLLKGIVIFDSVSDELKITELGTQTLHYFFSVKYGAFNYTFSATIILPLEDTTLPTFNWKLDDEIRILVDSTTPNWKEYFEVYDEFKRDGLVTINDSELILDTTGTYEVFFTVSDGITEEKTYTVTVHVVDINEDASTRKLIKKGNAIDGIAFKDYLLIEGDIIDDISVVHEIDTAIVGRYEVTFTFVDDFKNEKTLMIEVEVLVDLESPTITLIDHVQEVKSGEYEIYIAYGSVIESFLDFVKSVSDNYDQLSVEDIVVDAGGETLDTEQLRTYHVLYSVTDSESNTTSLKLSIHIQDNDSPSIHYKGEGNTLTLEILRIENGYYILSNPLGGEELRVRTNADIAWDTFFTIEDDTPVTTTYTIDANFFKTVGTYYLDIEAKDSSTPSPNQSTLLFFVEIVDRMVPEVELLPTVGDVYYLDSELRAEFKSKVFNCSDLHSGCDEDYEHSILIQNEDFINNETGEPLSYIKAEKGVTQTIKFKIRDKSGNYSHNPNDEDGWYTVQVVIKDVTLDYLKISKGEYIKEFTYRDDKVLTKTDIYAQNQVFHLGNYRFLAKMTEEMDDNYLRIDSIYQLNDVTLNEDRDLYPLHEVHSFKGIDEFRVYQQNANSVIILMLDRDYENSGNEKGRLSLVRYFFSNNQVHFETIEVMDDMKEFRELIDLVEVSHYTMEKIEFDNTYFYVSGRVSNDGEVFNPYLVTLSTSGIKIAYDINEDLKAGRITNLFKSFNNMLVEGYRVNGGTEEIPFVYGLSVESNGDLDPDDNIETDNHFEPLVNYEGEHFERLLAYSNKVWFKLIIENNSLAYDSKNKIKYPEPKNVVYIANEKNESFGRKKDMNGEEAFDFGKNILPDGHLEEVYITDGLNGDHYLFIKIDGIYHLYRVSAGVNREGGLTLNLELIKEEIINTQHNRDLVIDENNFHAQVNGSYLTFSVEVRRENFYTIETYVVKVK